MSIWCTGSKTASAGKEHLANFLPTNTHLRISSRELIDNWEMQLLTTHHVARRDTDSHLCIQHEPEQHHGSIVAELQRMLVSEIQESCQQNCRDCEEARLWSATTQKANTATKKATLQSHALT